MDRTEQKERLSDILISIEDLKEELNEKIPEVEKVNTKIDELADLMNDIGQIDTWDEEELKNNVLLTIFEDSYFQNIHNDIYDFDTELKEYYEELSDSKREKLEEKYYDLEDVLLKFDYSEQGYDDIESALKGIDEAIEKIKELLEMS